MTWFEYNQIYSKKHAFPEFQLLKTIIKWTILGLFAKVTGTRNQKQLKQIFHLVWELWKQSYFIGFPSQIFISKIFAFK